MASPNTPQPKVVAGGIAGALSILVLYGANLFGVDVPPEVASAFTVVVSFVAGYFKSQVIFGPYRGVVDLAHDGDTVYCRLDLGFDLTVYARVRVFGINAPELSTDAGKLARDYAQSIAPTGTLVSVLSHSWDKFGGRIDGEITLPGGLDFAGLMLGSGNAVPYKT